MKAFIKGTLRTLVAVAALSGIATTTTATHLAGGEITYQSLGSNIYRVQLNLYVDCSGIAPQSTASISLTSASCNVNTGAVIPMIGTPVPIAPICAASLPNSSCNNGPLYGISKVVYEGVITVPSACTDWVFSYTDCCRNGSVNNVLNANQSASYFETKLNNLVVPFNNSVQFSAPPVNIISAGMTTQLNWSAWDADMDSLVFELTDARSDAATSLTYNLGYSPLQPFMPILPTQLSANTGILSVTPNGPQVAIVCMRISEYRNGQLIAQTYRDLQINAIASSNSQPALTGMNGGTLFMTAGCPGDSIQFNVSASDPDVGQTLSITMDQSPAPAASFSVNGQPPVGSFLWIPSASDISSQPYVFTMRVNDDHCDYNGTQTYAYMVYVNGCNTNDVWPGDANSDGTADLFDLLALGMAFNDNGPVRPGASLNWVAQPCPNWTNSFPSTVNHKHADCNGDGTVDFSDTTAILLNYGLNHPLRVQPPVPMVGIPDLIVTASSDTVGTSSQVHFDISLGNPAAPADSIYGLAFRLYYDASLIDTNSVSVSYPGSMFGVNGTDMVTINRNMATPGYVDIALSRIDQLNISGTGPVARVTIVTTDNVSGKVTLYATPSDIEAISASGANIPIDPYGDSVIIDPFLTGISGPEYAPVFSVHPVPASEFLYLQFGDIIPDRLIIYDITGREVMRATPTSKETTLHISELTKGTYTIKAVTGTQHTTQRFLVH